MDDRWAEHPVRPRRTDAPASLVLAGLTLVVALTSAVLPVAPWLAAGASPAFDFQVWRPLLYGLTTGSLLQAVINGVFLVLVGRGLEPLVGSWQFAALYLLGGLGGATALSLVGVPVAFDGAICGIFAILAAMAVVKHAQHQDIRGDIILITLFIIWAIVIGSAAWVADIGAVVVGAAAGWVWVRTRWSAPARTGLGLGAVALVCLAAVAVTWLT